jgi:hypothetical protein
MRTPLSGRAAVTCVVLAYALLIGAAVAIAVMEGGSADFDDQDFIFVTTGFFACLGSGAFAALSLAACVGARKRIASSPEPRGGSALAVTVMIAAGLALPLAANGVLFFMVVMAFSGG